VSDLGFHLLIGVPEISADQVGNSVAELNIRTVLEYVDGGNCHRGDGVIAQLRTSSRSDRRLPIICCAIMCATVTPMTLTNTAPSNTTMTLISPSPMRIVSRVLNSAGSTSSGQSVSVISFADMTGKGQPSS